MTVMDAKSRFSDRVEHYIKYRPGYPRKELLVLLEKEIRLTPKMNIADIGSGTGISARIFLENGNTVYGIEPNEPMRKAAEGWLHEFPNFHSLHGSSEATNLPPHSIDLIVCAQAFHWFNPQLTKAEFLRIAHPDAYLCLIWNDRKRDAPFQQDYESLIQQFAFDYNEISHRNITSERIQDFFAPAEFKEVILYNEQIFDLESLIGRIISSSYMPNRNSPEYNAMEKAIIALFEKHEKKGEVVFAYDTLVYIGRIK